VNTLDVLLLTILVAAGIGGFRLGFVARVASWAGLALGLLLGARVLPTVIRALDDGSPTALVFAAIGTLIGSAFIGQAVGLIIGSRLHFALPVGRARDVDRTAGAAAGVIGVTLAFWFLLPGISDVRGWWAEQTRNSALAQIVDQRLPEPPDTLAALRNLIGEDQYPRVFDALQPAPDVGPPPGDVDLAPDVQERVLPSIVKVQGVACRRIQEGSGFVVAPDMVVTNAHVVAGEPDTLLFRDDGSEVQSDVVVFDPYRDLAILHAPGLDRPALPLGDIEPGGTGAVFGHPGGGSLRIAPFEVGRRVQATGADIYDRERTDRDVLVLAASLAPGDSGAALIGPGGDVVGVAFAIAPDRSGVAYALAVDELQAALAEDLTTEAATGPCLR
jgi:S1-C subfamily serine protease